MLSHTSSEGTTPTYPAEATIPGQTVFVKKGDVLNVSLTNNTAINIGLTPGGIEATPGDTKDFSYTADQPGTFAYYDAGSHLLGLFGALVVDKIDDTVQSLVEEDGVIKTVNKSELTKEFVMFMVGSTFWGTEIKSNTQTPLWTNPTLGALKDDVVRFHVLAVGPGHTFHLHGHRWPDETDFTGMSVNPNIIDVKLMPAGNASHSFTVRAGTGVGTGYWQYHCHLVSHMESGMAGKFHVIDPQSGGSGNSIAGASPSGAIYGNSSNDPGLVTFEITDEPGS